MTLPFGVDISSYQGRSIDYTMMKQNTKFVAVRAGISWGFEDPVFAQSWRALKGHNRIAYHVLYPSQDVTKQTDWLFDILSRADFDPKTDCIAIDIELWQGQTPQRVTEATTQMYDQITERTGRKPIIYSAAWFVNPRMVVTPKLAAADWWIANYPPKGSAPGVEHPGPPILPRGITQYLIHQTSETGIGQNVGLPSGAIDTNRWNGTLEDLRAYFGLDEGAPPEPEPPEDYLFQAKVYEWATPYVNIRKESSINSEDLGDLYPNTVVGVTSITGEWYGISNGFVMSRYLERLDLPLPITEKYYGALYWQRDPRWKDKPLGTSGTIGSYGCVMTAETNVLNQLGIVTNPVVNNAWRTSNGGYHNGNLIVWEKVSEQHPDIIWEGKTWNPTDEQIKQKIAAGCPLVMLVDHNEGTSALDEHWVNSIPSPADDDAIWIHDPWDNLTIRLRDRYKKPIQQLSSYRRTI